MFPPPPPPSSHTPYQYSKVTIDCVLRVTGSFTFSRPEVTFLNSSAILQNIKNKQTNKPVQAQWGALLKQGMGEEDSFSLCFTHSQPFPSTLPSKILIPSYGKDQPQHLELKCNVPVARILTYSPVFHPRESRSVFLWVKETDKCRASSFSLSSLVTHFSQITYVLHVST